ncbi:hypothetical protein ACEQ8H_008049 [Pleosporales sp. CAS-2024a]
MFFKTVLIGGLLAAGHANAIKLRDVSTLLQRSNHVERDLLGNAQHIATLTRRQDSSAAGTGPLASILPASGNASNADTAQWEAETKKACMETLGKLNGKATNPSGIVVCYNLPFLDKTTGVFQAELRMYNMSAPVRPWVGITAADVSLTLSYLGATVQNMAGNFSKRDIGYPPVRREVGEGLLVERQSTKTLTEMKVLMYVGRVNSNLLGPAMNVASLKRLLVPEIDLSATNPVSGEQVETTLSGDATFVNGIFAKAANGPTNVAPGVAASASADVQSAAPFVVPGQHIEIAPIGVSITCAWAGLFFLVVGGGTYGRIQFREQYRRRIRTEAARGVRTI